MEQLDGVLVATSVPFDDDLAVDGDAFAEHCAWLVAEGCRGIVPNGSLGEYQHLTDSERADLVRIAVESSGGAVIPGVSAQATSEAVGWTEQAAQAGAIAVMCLPPTGLRASRAETVAHFRAVAAVGLPVVAYNNPYDTKVDLTPDLLAELAGIDGIVAVKEFTGDVRRVADILDAAPTLDVVCGCDDVILESLLMGAVGWISGFANVFPRACVDLYEAGRAGKAPEAVATYRELLPAFHWDARPEFIQAIKLGLDLVGRRGGPIRPPRLPLPDDDRAACETDLRRALRAV